MKAKLNLPQELMTGIDVMNTLNGGTSEPIVKLAQFPSFRQITVRIPGVDVGSIKIEINNNQLMIYYMFTMTTRDKEVSLPKVLYNKGIPYFVDAKNISASEEDNKLVVRLPFNELANGYHRDIKVSQ